MTRHLLLLILLFLATATRGQDEATLAAPGSQVPEFTFEVAPGQRASITDYRGKVVLITFFATWCGPCRQELPHVDKEIYLQYPDGQKVVLLTFGREHDWDTVLKFRKEQKFAMPLYPDPERKIFSLFATQNIPRNFLVDRSGKIIYASTGFNKTEFEKLQKEISHALQ